VAEEGVKGGHMRFPDRDSCSSYGVMSKCPDSRKDIERVLEFLSKRKKRFTKKKKVLVNLRIDKRPRG